MIRVFHHIFFLKKAKGYEKEPISIYLRITVAGKRAEISINRKVETLKWISNPGRMKGTIEKVKKFNAYLFKNKYTGVCQRQRMLIPIFEKHNNEFSALVPKEYSAATLERYKTSLAHTIEFMKWKYGISDIDIRDINHEFITNYDFFLRSVRHCANNTTVKYVKNFKKIVRICIANGWLEKDPFVKYKARLKAVERVFLCEEELQAVMQKELTIERLNQVKDIFIFSCLTALAYSDVKKITCKNIITGTA